MGEVAWDLLNRIRGQRAAAGEVDPVALASVVEDLAGGEINHVHQAGIPEPGFYLLPGVPGQVMPSGPMNP